MRNLKSAYEHPDVVSDALKKEIAADRVMGPFPYPPFKTFQVSPLGCVEKKVKNTFRLIFDLSSPRNGSINDYIHDMFSSVSYSSLDDALKLVRDCGPGAFMAKTDIKSAFRLLPIRPDQYHLFCFSWEGEFFFDRSLQLGCRSACNLFESVSSAIEHLAIHRAIRWIIHYLDDFFLVRTSRDGAKADLVAFLALLDELGIPYALEKTIGPFQILPFTGIEIDTLKEVARLPEDKIKDCLFALSCLRDRKKCQRRELESLIGRLSFACKVVVPGRAFLRRLYGATAGVRQPYHYVRLTKEMHKDLEIWSVFLKSFNGMTYYRNEMFLSPLNKHLFTDSSQSLGTGAIFGPHWFSIPWPSSWWSSQTIIFLELVPIVLALEAWGESFRNACVTLHTDNLPLVDIINSQSSKEPLVMCLVRRLVLQALKCNILIQAVHIMGKKNVQADILSRLLISQFKVL